MTVEHSFWLLAVLFLANLGLSMCQGKCDERASLVSEAAVRPEPKAPPGGNSPSGADTACRVAVRYVIEHYSQARSLEKAPWSQKRLLGVRSDHKELYDYCVGDWVVTVLPRPEAEPGSLVVVDNGASGFLWRGTVGAGGQVRELRVDEAS